MPAAAEVVRQYARYHTFALNLYIAGLVFERACDLTIVTNRNTTLFRGPIGAATGCPGQDTHESRNEDPFHT